MTTSNLKQALRGLFTAAVTAALVILAACSGGGSAEDREFNITPQNDWQKMGLYGTPKKVVLTVEGNEMSEYYLFNTLGYITEYGDRKRIEQYKFDERPVEVYTYDSDSTTLLNKREYSYSNYSQNGKPTLYIDYDYDKWGNVVRIQRHTTRDYTSDDPKYTTEKPTEYRYDRVDKRTYEEYRGEDLKRRIVYDEHRNPVKITEYDDDGRLYQILRHGYQYNDAGLMTVKIDYRYSLIDPEDYEPEPVNLWRYRYSDKGVLLESEVALVENLPEGWEKDIAGLEKKLFSHRPDKFLWDRDGKALVQYYQRYNDNRGNWGSVRQYAPKNVTVRRSFSYYDETDVPEPQPYDEDYGC